MWHRILAMMFCLTCMCSLVHGSPDETLEQLDNAFASLGSHYRLVRCQALEGHQSCIPAAVAQSLSSANMLTSITNPLLNQYLSSIFYNVDIRVRTCPFAQAVVVSHYLARALERILNNPAQTQNLLTVLQSLPNSHNSIILNALQRLNSGVSNSLRARIIHALLDDLRLGLDQMDSAEVAVLLAMTSGKPILIIDVNHDGAVAVIQIHNAEGQVVVTTENVDLSDLPALGQQLAALLSQTTLHFVSVPQYGLLPISPLAIQSIQRVPVAERETAYQAIYTNLRTGEKRVLVGSDGGFDSPGRKPVTSRHIPKLNPKSIRKVRPKWSDGQSFRESGSSGSYASSAMKLASGVVVVSLGTYFLAQEKIRNYLWHVVCGKNNTEQCVSDYYSWMKEVSFNGAAAGYERVCGDMSWSDCRAYYETQYWTEESQ